MPEKVAAGRLNVGVDTRLQFQFSGIWQGFKVTGVLIGSVPDEFLIIRFPPVPGILSRLEAGTPVIGRYVYAGNVYGFSSTVLASTHKPALMAFLAYPASVETMNLRKSLRIECHFPALLKTDLGVFKAVMADISLGGCRVRIDNESTRFSNCDINQVVEVSFHLPGITQEKVINGEVKNLKRDKQLYEMGIQFDRGNEAVLNEVKEYIDSFSVPQSLQNI